MPKLLLFLAVFGHCALATYTTLSLNEGSLRGEVVNSNTTGGGDLARFLGVPFAQPPIGDLRYTMGVSRANQSYHITRV